jgi:PAS domain S-box-containing protein
LGDGLIASWRGESNRLDRNTSEMTELFLDSADRGGRIRSHDVLMAVTENMTEGLICLDAAGQIAFANRTAASLLGWPLEDLLGRGMHEAIHYERIDGTPYPPRECQIIGSIRSSVRTRLDRDDFIRRDGTHIPVSWSASPLHVDHGDGAIIVFEDASEHVAAQLEAERALAKLSWIGRVQDALDHDGFVLYAQPIMKLSTGAITRHELLIRMKGPGGQAVLPGQFLPAAEEYGLIRRIDEWVITQAISLATRGFDVEFNVSAHSIGRTDLVRLISERLASTGARPERLVCEITETALMKDISDGEAFVRALRDLGCRVALDDFGAGFGSMAYIKRLPVSYVKIDMQFVQDLTREASSRHVVKAIVSLARGFGIETVAEGAEDDDTISMLRDLDVDYVQGFGIARPGPLEEILSAPA